MPTHRERLRQQALNRLAADIALGEVRIKKNLAEADLASLKKEKQRLQSAPADPEVTAWCTDYSIDLTGEVGTIEIPDERTNPVVITPSSESAAIFSMAQHGQIQPAIAAHPFNFFYNRCIFPAWQKDKPHHRVGVLTSVDKGADTCSITLDDALSSEQNLDINQDTALTAVPIIYQTCNSAVFEIDDRVVVRFTGQDFSEPVVIGFESNPKPCSFSGYFLVRTTTLANPDSGPPELTYERQIIQADNGPWEALDQDLIAGNVDWQGQNGESVSWFGLESRYFYWIMGGPEYRDGSGTISEGQVQHFRSIPIVLNGSEIFWFGWDDTIYIDGVVAKAGLSLPCMGAALIVEMAETWCVQVLAVLSNPYSGLPSEDRHPGGECTEFYVRIWPLSDPSDSFLLATTLDVSAMTELYNDTDTINSDRDKILKGQYLNIAPWYFDSTGKKASAILYDKAGGTFIPSTGRTNGTLDRWELNITGSGGAPGHGGTMDAVWTKEESAIITEHQMVKTEIDKAFNPLIGTLNRYTIGDNAIITAYQYKNSFEYCQDALFSVERVYTQESVIAVDYDENDNLVKLIWDLEEKTYDIQEESYPGQLLAVSHLQDPDYFRTSTASYIEEPDEGGGNPSSGELPLRDGGHYEKFSHENVRTDKFKIQIGGGGVTTVYENTYSHEGGTIVVDYPPNGPNEAEQTYIDKSPIDTIGASVFGVLAGADLRKHQVFIYERDINFINGGKVYSEPFSTPGPDTVNKPASNMDFRLVVAEVGKGNKFVNVGSGLSDDDLYFLIERVDTYIDRALLKAIHTVWPDTTSRSIAVATEIPSKDILTVDPPEIQHRMQFPFSKHPTIEDSIAAIYASGWVPFDSNQLIPHYGVATNGDATLVSCEAGLSGGVALNNSRIFPGNVDPVLIIDAVADPDFAGDDTIKFFPVISWLTPPP